MAPKSFLDLGGSQRKWFAAGWILVQMVVIATAWKRPDRIFGFQMFNESSTIEFELARRVRRDGKIVEVSTNGNWQAKDKTGARRKFRWSDQVKDPILSVPGVIKDAKYGAEAQLFRLQRALDHVALRTQQDKDTKALVAHVRIVKNGHPPVETTLESARR